MPVVTAVDRPLPLHVGTESEVVWRMADFYRATILVKCEGLEAADLARRAVPPSTLSLLGLVRHSTQVEHYWFERVFLGRDVGALYSTREDPDAEFNDLTSEPPETSVARFLAQCEVSREVARAHDLDELSTLERIDGRVSLRYIAVHMVDEYARHCGHADLLREVIDGAVGD